MTYLCLPPFLLRAAIRGHSKRRKRQLLKQTAISRDYDRHTAAQISTLAICLLVGAPCLVIAVLYFELHPLHLFNIGWVLLVGVLPALRIDNRDACIERALKTFRGVSFNGVKARAYDQETHCRLIWTTVLTAITCVACVYYTNLIAGVSLLAYAVSCLPATLIGALCITAHHIRLSRRSYHINETRRRPVLHQVPNVRRENAMSIVIAGLTPHPFLLRVSRLMTIGDLLCGLRRRRLIPCLRKVSHNILYPPYQRCALPDTIRLCDAEVVNMAVLHVRVLVLGGAKGKGKYSLLSNTSSSQQPATSTSGTRSSSARTTDTMPICPQCQEGFTSKRMLNLHLKVCDEIAIPQTFGQPIWGLEQGPAKLRRTATAHDVASERNAQAHHPSSTATPDPGCTPYAPIFPDEPPTHERPEEPPAEPPPRIPHCPPPLPLPPPERVLQPTRSGRQRRFPRQYNDYIPSQSIHSIMPPRPPSPTTEPQPETPQSPPPSSPKAPMNPLPEQYSEHLVDGWFNYEPDHFGVYRSYPQIPSYVPDEEVDIEELADGPGLTKPTAGGDFLKGIGPLRHLTTTTIAPFLSVTAFRLMSWWYSAKGVLSSALLDSLVRDVLLQPDFDVGELHSFSAKKEMKRMDDHWQQTGIEGGWRTGSVTLSLPCEGVKHHDEDHAPTIEVKGVLYRPLLEVIRAALKHPSAKALHLFPFRLLRRSSTDPEGPPEQLLGEIYNLPSVIEEHRKVQEIPFAANVPKSLHNIESVVLTLPLYSDSTSLAQFGTASLWPIYLWFGNLSKYVRSKMSSFSAHHVGYMPTLPDELVDAYREKFGKPPSAPVLTFLKRELVQEILYKLLLDAEFEEAYRNGIIFECLDGVTRRIFPRLIYYSADYPEKSILASIKTLGTFACPRCKVPTDLFDDLGTYTDRQLREKRARQDSVQRQDRIEKARGRIFEQGIRVNDKGIDEALGPTSETPHRNTFSWRLGVGFLNYFDLFAVDLMHEFELGVWKAVFVHLLRILQAQGQTTVQELNTRYRSVPRFGRDTIRKVHKNVSDLKKLAARDYEDYLQCALPVFEGLLPEPFNSIILDMLFVLATWHALAKLRLHTPTTLADLDKETTALGEIVRRFRSMVCSAYRTKELPRETAARARRDVAAAGKKPNGSTVAKNKNGKGRASAVFDGDEPAPTKTPRTKGFNINTYKFHSLGDYVNSIKQFGTTDNTSTQTGESEHRRVKRFAPRTTHQDYAAGISKHVEREGLINTIRETLAPLLARKDKTSQSSDEDDSKPISPLEHHAIASSQKDFEDIDQWLRKNRHDPVIDGFKARLHEHLLRRAGCVPSDGVEFTPLELSQIAIHHNRLYRHKTMRINYTTYDMRRAQDVINPNFHSDVLTLAAEGDAHPYTYAKIISIFHVKVIDYRPSAKSRAPQMMPVLWARWYNFDEEHTSGWYARRLHRVGFAPGHGRDAFEFLDPSSIVRAAHLIPAFATGRTAALLAESQLARPNSSDEQDYTRYYVNVFADRDMFMRYRGGGVGHQELSTLIFEKDRRDEGNPEATDDQETSDSAAHAGPSTLEHAEDLEDDLNTAVNGVDDGNLVDDFFDSDDEDEEVTVQPDNALDYAEDSDIEEGFGAL